MEIFEFNLPVNFLYFLSNWVNLLGIFTTCEKLRAFERNQNLEKQLSDVLEMNSLTLKKVLTFFLEIWQKIERNANFKQWFNVFLIISEAWQGYDLKAYGVSKPQSKVTMQKVQ